MDANAVLVSASGGDEYQPLVVLDAIIEISNHDLNQNVTKKLSC